jgi:solute carrier family 12 (sodium/potassium/chloride transporter), member 2
MRLKLNQINFYFLFHSMANLLAKLRIDYSSLTMVQGVTEKPQEATIEMHNQLLNGFLEGQREENFISNIERTTLQMKTYRQLRLREMLTEHSKNANMVVMSLPMPRQV